jgi:hypothetical protein
VLIANFYYYGPLKYQEVSKRSKEGVCGVIPLFKEYYTYIIFMFFHESYHSALHAYKSSLTSKYKGIVTSLLANELIIKWN